MTDDIDYSNYPQSIAEIKAKTGADWTPRDALIAALRDLDSGELKMNRIIIVCGDIRPDGSTKTTYYQSTQNRYEFFGMVEELKGERIKADVRNEQ